VRSLRACINGLECFLVLAGVDQPLELGERLLQLTRRIRSHFDRETEAEPPCSC
jgi:hypothetical protein